MSYPSYPPHLQTSTNKLADIDWHVLVLFTDPSETEIKGIWGPYTDAEIANSALDELRQWPLDGVWDVRRLNRFVAAKSGNAPNSLQQWTWQSSCRTADA